MRRKQKRIERFLDYQGIASLIRDFVFPSGGFTLEMGSGNGQFLNQLAERYPERLFIGIDRKRDRLSKACGEAQLKGLKNVRYVHALVESLSDYIQSETTDEIWIQFPDPYPKPSKCERRLIHPHYLAFYHRIMVPGGIFHFKTDNPGLFEFGLESIRDIHPQFQILEVCRNLQQDERDDDGGIQTKYESVWRKQNLSIYYLRAARC
ncbi:MAG: tRNA (guanosine(46)-N7)-methyltransferase TrmB [Candidatus Delongbacteria bacterium]|nr:tRNA (guanosine(46)-N7)-methyltransferase TrmB [Candidatus Delongbacteria bacterium]